MSHDYEKLGAFYLGRSYDPDAGEPTEEMILYDAKDLTTHAVCVGMTGSGKTGLCVSMIEEAALDGVPVLAIDPKGDLGNLLLTFPALRPADFEPWIDESAAARKGLDRKGYAAKTAKLWKSGLASWGQDGTRIQRLKGAADFAIYTPGSRTGRPLAALRSLAAPPDEVLRDDDARTQRVSSAVAGLLALLGIEADPLRGKETIFLANLLESCWSEGRSLDLAGLIRAVQEPPFERVGVLDLESFYPAKDRFELAMAINGLLASPGFAAWLEGEPLNIERLLWTPEGKPRVSVLSIAHLSDRERMFFVTLLLGELIAWMRGQPGTSSLRAILYMDEIFGYLPPVANPPSKTPFLTLLKQARAYGVGLVLATQNPVDLDYKALSNTGTWMLGRLQTERDKARVLDGLEGASASAGQAFDRKRVDALLSGLDSRVFLLNNVHEDAPVLFHTRWAMSYLCGPLTLAQIKTLTPGSIQAAPAAPRPEPSPVSAGGERPVLPPGTPEVFVVPAKPAPAGSTLLYRPCLLGEARLHYVAHREEIDHWSAIQRLAVLEDENISNPWPGADEPGEAVWTLAGDPEPGASFDPAPVEVGQKSPYRSWSARLRAHAYETCAIDLWKAPALKLASKPGEDEGAFRARLTISAREHRDLQVEKLRAKFAPKLARLEKKIRSAEQRVEREESQYSQQKLQSAISVASGVLGALLGRRTLGRATTAVRGLGRTTREKDDVARAKDTLEDLQRELAELETQAEEAVAELEAELAPEAVELEPWPLSPRKSDIAVTRVALAWRPWAVRPDGLVEPLVD